MKTLAWYICDHKVMNGIAEIVNGFQSLIIFIKSSILDVSLGSKYASEFAHPYKTFPNI